MKKRIVSFTLLSLLSVSSFQVYSAPRDLNNISQEKQDVKSGINSKRNEIENVLKEIDSIDSKMRSVTDELEKIESDIVLVEKDIEKTNTELKESKKKLESKKDEFKNRLSAMYMTGTMSSLNYIELVLEANDITDFIVRINSIKEIVNYDTKVIKDVIKIKTSIEEKEKSLVGKEIILKKSASDVISKKNELDKISDEKVAYMNSLKQDENLQIAKLNSLDEEANRIITSAKAQELAKKASQNNSSNSSGNSNSGGSISPPAPPRPSGGMIRPASGGYISAEFAENRGSYTHKGIDIAIPTGTPLYAVANGVVTASYYSSSYGEVIFIDHGGITTVYAHASRRMAQVGQTVSQGQVIALSGNTGDSTGPHLHFEVIVGGVKVNPRGYISF